MSNLGFKTHMSEDVIDDIITDHREMEDYYKKYKSAENIEDSKKWFNMFLWEICRHSVAEEIVIYTMMEKKDEKGKELAYKSREDHRRLKELLEDLRKEKDNIKFDEKFDIVFKELEEHIASEEENDLVYLKESFTLDERMKASKSFAMKKKLAPTRPHPGIPDKPTAIEMGLGLLVAPLDKIRDVFTSFPEPKETSAI